MNENAQSARPILYGSAYSVYVRIVRLVLLEKKVAYDLRPVDIFNEEEHVSAYEKIHPFKKIPALSHGGNTFYETSAITRYLDEIYDNPRLMPDNPVARARVNQIISIIDNYAYPAMVWGVYVPLSEKQKTAEDQEVQAALKKARTALDAIGLLMERHQENFFGSSISLADIYAIPVFDYFCKTRIGLNTLEAYPTLVSWWENASSQPGYSEILQEE